MATWITCLLLLTSAVATHAWLWPFSHPKENTGDQGDEITNLPGLYPPPSFKQYSGYLTASDTRNLFYWFVESQGDPGSDPLVVWLSGGPGCSSISGLLTENGPFRVRSNGNSLYYNRYSWNKISNMLFLETPVGVGFSYSTDGNLANDDDQVALDNYHAIQDFFQKYPQFADHDFYVTGESYAGVYIPTLLMHLKDDPDINIKGAAIGNGYFKPPILDNTKLAYWYYHGIIGTETWEDIINKCCDKRGEKCQYSPFRSTQCQDAVGDALVKVSLYPLNPYNIYDDCVQNNLQWVIERKVSSVISFRLKQMARHPDPQQMPREFTKYSFDTGSNPTCKHGTLEEKFMNRQQTRQALHIPDEVGKWTQCSSYISDGNSYTQLYDDMTSQFKDILQDKNIRLLLYNGDLDTTCDFLGNELFVDSLDIKETKPHQPWFYTNFDGSKQIGGFMKEFNNLVYMTVKGAGHLVPTDQPIASLQMFKDFLKQGVNTA